MTVNFLALRSVVLRAENALAEARRAWQEAQNPSPVETLRLRGAVMRAERDLADAVAAVVGEEGTPVTPADGRVVG